MKNQTNSNTLSLSPLAMEYLGLTKQPFESVILSDSAIFTDAILDQLLDTTKHHLQFSDLLLIIEGNIGSGKTTLFRRILQSEVSNTYLLSIHAEATDTLTQIQQKMSLHLKQQDEISNLDENLKNLQVFDQKPVLVIDDAHVLSDTTLQELLRYQKKLEKEQETQLKILLLANKGMANTLEQISDLQHNQLYVQEMPEYTPKQIQAFVQHKINLADYSGEPILENNDIQTIFKKGDGSPLSIMELSVSHIEKLAKKKNKTSSIQLKPVLLLISTVVLIGIAGFIKFYLSDASLTEVPFERAVAPTLHLQNEEPVEATVVEDDIPQKDNLVHGDDDPIVPFVKPLKETLISSGSPNDNNRVTEETTPEIEENLQVITQETTRPIIKPDTTEIITDTPLTKATPSIKQEIIKNPTETVVPIVTEQSPDIKETVPAIEETQLYLSLQKLNQLGVHDKNWILVQDKSHWSLQIAGARDPDTLLYIAKRYKLSENSAWYETQLTGKPWYVLIYGLYTHRDAANEAKKFLPGDLRSRKPFSRSFNSIQPSVR
jgi:DamX protein